jgi:hypothetical protein
LGWALLELGRGGVTGAITGDGLGIEFTDDGGGTDVPNNCSGV